MLRHYDQEERQTDGSKHWDIIRPTLVRAFAREEARDFDDEHWLMLIHEGSTKMRIEYCEDNNGSLCYLRAFQGHSDTYHRGISWNFQSLMGSGLIPGGIENDRARQSVFCTALNPFGQDTEEELVVSITLFLKNNTLKHIGNAIKMRYVG